MAVAVVSPRLGVHCRCVDVFSPFSLFSFLSGGRRENTNTTPVVGVRIVVSTLSPLDCCCAHHTRTRAHLLYLFARRGRLLKRAGQLLEAMRPEPRILPSVVQFGRLPLGGESEIVSCHPVVRPA